MIGVGLNLVGSVCINAGTNMLKLSLRAQKPTEVRYLGMYYFALGSGINFVSFGLAAQSLLAALGGVQFIANCLFGVIILNEQVTNKHLGATLALALGVALAVVYADHEQEAFTLQDILNLYSSHWLTFCTAELGAVLIAEAVHQVYLHDTARKLPLHHLVLPLTYSFVSACIGTQSVLQSKCIAELIKTFLLTGSKEWDILCNTDVLLMVLAFLFFLGIWLHRLMRALSLYDGLVIIPILQVSWTLCAIVNGGIFFGEFQSYSWTQTVFFSSGITLILAGVFVLAGSSTDDGSKEAEPILAEIDDSDFDESSSEHSGLSMNLPPQLCVHQVVPSPMNCRAWLSAPSTASLVINKLHT